MKTYTIKEASDILGKSKSTVRYQYEHNLPITSKVQEGGILFLTEEGLSLLQAHFNQYKTAQTNEPIKPSEPNETAQTNELLTERTEQKTSPRKALEDRIKSLEIENAVLTERIEQMQAHETERTERTNKQIESLNEQILFLRNQLQSASVNLYKALPAPKESFLHRLFNRRNKDNTEGKNE